MSRRLAIPALVLAIALGAGGAAQASPAADDLGRCLVKSTNATDRTDLMVWVFTALSAHPAVKAYANVTDAQRVETSKVTARLLERLITADCHTEALAAIKGDGPASLQQAFSVLGQVAVAGLVKDPAVSGAMSQVTAQLDMTKFQALAMELMNAAPASK
jgi:hypothetical protein